MKFERIVSMLALILVMALVAIFAGFPAQVQAQATSYYVGGAGSDTNSGTSAAPWKTIGKLNAQDLNPGDKVFFKGGETFPGNLKLTAEDAGTALNPVVVSSFGAGRATIAPASGVGIDAYNAGGVAVENINVKGTKLEASGVRFFTDLPGGKKLDYVRINNVDASGFNSGISIGSYPKDGSKSGYRNVRIDNAVAHGNKDVGILTTGYYKKEATTYAHEDVRVGNSKAFSNLGDPNKDTHTGSGIVLGDVNGGVVEDSVAYDNGRNNSGSHGGPVGIWAYDSNAITIQRNESFGNKTSNGKDGGGFDFDGGTTNSLMQYNYSHDNDGAGYLIMEFPNGPVTSNNVVRYNISYNDSRNNLSGIRTILGAKNTLIHNNTVYMSPRADGIKPAAITTTGTSGTKHFNNILATTGGAPLVVARSNTGATFGGNGYWSYGGKFTIIHQGKYYGSLKAFRASGQERNTGVQANPLFNSPGFKVNPTSPMINRAVNLRSVYGVNPGSRDYYGGPIPVGAGYDIGSHEAR